MLHVACLCTSNWLAKCEFVRDQTPDQILKRLIGGAACLVAPVRRFARVCLCHFAHHIARRIACLLPRIRLAISAKRAGNGASALLSASPNLRMCTFFCTLFLNSHPAQCAQASKQPFFQRPAAQPLVHPAPCPGKRGTCAMPCARPALCNRFRPACCWRAWQWRPPALLPAHQQARRPAMPLPRASP